MKVLFLTIAFSILSGCAITPAEMKHSERMYDKQLTAIKETKPIPILRITALPGQTIKFDGVQEFTVFNPSNNTNAIPSYKLPENVGAKIAEKLIDKGADVILGKFGLDGKLSDNSRNISAGDSDLAKQINRSNTIENPFTAP